MEPTTPVEQHATTPHEAWHAPLARNTSVSRILAAVLFVVLPFLGFWLGVEYAQTLPHTKQMVQITGEGRSIHPGEWMPSSLYASLAAGESTTTTVTFVPTQNASNMSVLVMPEIAPYVSVSPTSFSQVTKGTSHDLDVTFSAPVDMIVGVYDGTIQLVQGVRALARPLPVDITFSPIPLPPDPGEAGKVTIEGIDSDGDGVRDDVQRWIVLSFPDDQQIRAALRERAVVMQEALTTTDDEARAVALAERLDRTSECIRYVAANDASTIRTSLDAELLNTIARDTAYLAYDRQLGGHTFPVHPVNEWQQSCSFDVDTIESAARD